MFDSKKMQPIINLIGVNREPTNQEMQAAAMVAIEIVCSVVNSLETIAGNIEAIVSYRHDEAAVNTR